MLLPVCHHHSSLPPKPLPVSYFPSPLPRNLFHHPHILPNSPLLRQIPTAAAYGNPETLPQSAIKRIADKLRSLGYVEDDQKKPQENNSQNPGPENGSPGEIFIPLPKHLPKYRVGHTIDQSWSTPENPIPMPGYGKSIQRYHELRRVVNAEREKEREKRKGEVKEEVPTMAELTLTREELRRLRDEGIKLKKKIKLGKAGITEGIVNGIHERWRTTELVRIACEDICRLNMKRTHDLLERKTGGLVVWRSGGNLILYRGVDYKYPYFNSDKIPNPNDTSVDTSTSSDMDGVGKSSRLVSSEKVTQPRLIQGVGLPNRVRFQLPGETELAEVADRLLDGLGPRFTDWWGYDPLPVDADLLPATVSGYRRPFRLLPYGIQPKLTNDEMTILKRLGNPLPCHFALGRNRKLQGLAASMVKLWEKCEIAKIAVKRGVQNTNSELMAEELKLLTGGTLLSRDKEFIVFYRGKDFLSAAVSSAIEERRRSGYRSLVSVSGNYKHETVDPMGKEESNEIMDKGKIIVTEPGKPKSTEVAFERTSNKLERTLEKKAEAEKILAELEKEEVPQQAELDKEGITEEERFMLRKIGLKMKPFLLLGRRGVFAGTVENMHLHWKYRELVKIICGGRSTEEVYKRAQILEAESGGILVAVERVSKGYAIIVYRGKNYERPASLRPQTLLTKRQAMKRSIEAQRRESLKLHVLKLGEDIEELKLEAVKGKDTTIQSADQSNFDVVQEGFGAYSSSFHSNGGIDVSGATEEHEFRLTDTDLSSESDVEDSDDPVGMNVEPATLPDEQKSRAQACFVSAVNAESDVHQNKTMISDVHQNKTMIPFVKSMDTVAEISVKKAEESIFAAVAPRARRLSNRDRLILRKHALKMKKRPVLAVGRSNIVTGVAKTIKAHFEKYPLAIVNVKGRAKGTSVQEVVFKLEQETESVMVSQEPSKVILYRGWGLEKELGQNTRETLARREGGNCWPVISPELMSAIRLECGLHSSLAGKKHLAQ